MHRARLVLICTVLFCSIGAKLTLADGDLHKMNHIIIVMQENHSFNNYFGVLAYAPGSPYHNANGSCLPNDVRLHLTSRDQFANPQEDLFDFSHSPSLNTPIDQAAPPSVDCTP